MITISVGMTEAGGGMCMQWKDCEKIESVGHLCRGGLKMKVLDLSTGATLGSNQKGELCFKLDTLMLGYYKNPEKTREMIDDEGMNKPQRLRIPYNISKRPSVKKTFC